MGKLWSLVFLLVPILGVGVFVISWWGREPSTAALISLPWYEHWLPLDISEHGYRIDDLFYFILYLTGAVFIATEVALPLFLWRYDSATNRQPAKFTHGSHNLEVVWTVLPAVTLVFIALHQLDAWAENKMKRGEPAEPLVVQVTGRQFEWRFVYPGADGKLHTPDDVHTVNDLHIPVNRDILVVLKSQDVLHSFFLPNLRVKQDAVPGMKQNVWFKALRTGEYDIVCAELCGWGHYKMKGRLTIQKQDDYDQWLARMTEEENRTESLQKNPSNGI